MKTLNIDFLRDALSYDPETGMLRWRQRPRLHFRTDRGWRCFNSRFAGRIAGSVASTTGYVMVNFSGGNLLCAHRLIIAMHTGHWPEFVDHVDGNRRNNALDNLRICTRSDNQCNRGVQSNNRSGFKGISPEGSGKWRAQICKSGQRRNLGVFLSPEAAHAAYVRAAQQLHGEFSNSGTRNKS